MIPEKCFTLTNQPGAHEVVSGSSYCSNQYLQRTDDGSSSDVQSSSVHYLADA